MCSPWGHNNSDMTATELKLNYLIKHFFKKVCFFVFTIEFSQMNHRIVAYPVKFGQTKQAAIQISAEFFKQ